MHDGVLDGENLFWTQVSVQGGPAPVRRSLPDLSDLVLRRVLLAPSGTPLPHTDRHPRTPDGRYFVVRGRLWRLSNPALEQKQREDLVRELMAARRAVRDAAQDPVAMSDARSRVNVAKHALGERGAPWWNDGAPDYNRCLAKNTPYAAWFSRIDAPTE